MIATALLFAKSALSWLLDLFKRYPWQMLCLALIAASLWLYSGKAEYREKYAAEQTARKAERAEWERNVASAKAAAAKARKDAQEIAGEADKTHDALLADNAGLERYIADHRVRAQTCPAASSGSSGSSGIESPAIPERAPESAVVAVEDIRTCDSNFAYALSAFQWVQGLRDRGLVER